MTKYKVTWEVSKHSIVEAANEQEAINLVGQGDTEQIEDEMTTGFEAMAINIGSSCIYNHDHEDGSKCEYHN